MPAVGEPENRTPLLGAAGTPANNWAQWFTRVYRALAGQYFYIPTVSGAPAGPPELRVGYAPIVFDPSTGILYAHDGTNWLSVTLT